MTTSELEKIKIDAKEWAVNERLTTDKSYQVIYDEMMALYPDCQVASFRTIQSQVQRYLTNNKDVKPLPKKEEKIDVKELIMKHSKRGIDKKELQEITKTTEKEINKHISELQDNAHTLDVVNDMVILQKKPMTGSNEIKRHIKGTTHTFGIVSDCHMNSKYQQITYLNDFYDYCYDRGITDMYNVGDISDGFYKIRPDHIYQLFNFGFDEQADYIIDNYPFRKGMNTRFITGNHDDTHIKNGGSNIGKKIAKEREDMEYLGANYAKVWLTPKCDMDLIHPQDGSAYALSYKAQKRIDGLQGGNKPRIMAIGHYHKKLYMLYRNIHVFMCPSFQAQTPFLQGRGIYGDVGGWIVTINVDETGEIKSIIPELINYYKMLTNDY